MAIEKKIKILGAVLELTAKHHSQFSLFTAKAGSSKTVPTILIVMGADYSFELISDVHWVPQFFMYKINPRRGVYYSHKNTAVCTSALEN